MTRILTPETDDDRARCGERNRQAKLTEEDVGGIRAALRMDITQSTLAIVYGVSQTAIGAIARGETWRWLK